MQQTQRGRKVKKSQSSKKIRSQTEDPKKKSLNRKPLCLKYYFVGPGNNGKLISNYLSQQSGWKILDAESGKSSNDFYLKWVQTNSEIQFQQFKEGQYSQFKNYIIMTEYFNIIYEWEKINEGQQFYSEKLK